LLYKSHMEENLVSDERLRLESNDWATAGRDEGMKGYRHQHR
jgi:hypothetical protein